MLTTLIAFLFLLVFLLLILIPLQEGLLQYLHQKYQLIYHRNDPKYSINLRRGCLPGCTADGKCLYGNYCYDALGPNPQCCAYDFQCSECSKEHQNELDYIKKKRVDVTTQTPSLAQEEAIRKRLDNKILMKKSKLPLQLIKEEKEQAELKMGLEQTEAKYHHPEGRPYKFWSYLNSMNASNSDGN